MKSILSLVIALFIVGTSGEKAGAVTLRADISVDSDVIRLGDVFSGVDKKASMVVADAPAPGERLILRAKQLRNIAERGGLKWATDNHFVRTTVTRRARLIETGAIRAKVVAALRAEGLDRNWQVEFGRIDMTVEVAIDEIEPVRVVNPRYSVHGKMFAAILEIPRGRRPPERLNVTGKIYQVTKVPVLARRVQRGETVREHDIEFVSMPRDKIGRTVLLDRAGIVGQESRRLLTAGKPVRAGDLRPPVVVEKGALVTIVLRTDRMLITARGKALDDGAAGESVRVLNTRSRQTIEAVVEGRNRVTVAFASGS